MIILITIIIMCSQLQLRGMDCGPGGGWVEQRAGKMARTIIEPLAGVYKPVLTQPLQNDVFVLSNSENNSVLLDVWFGQVP